MRCWISLLAGALLAACAPDERPPTPAPAAGETAVAERPRAPAPQAAPVTSLAGEWRVAGIDGEEYDQPVGLALSGSADELWWEPRCAYVIRSYRISGNQIRFGPPVATDPPLPQGSPPRPVCTIGLLPKLPDVMRALDAATTVVRTPENGVLISGGGHSVLLFSQ